MIKTKTTFETYRTIDELLTKNKKLYYTRFGDGDIFIMKGVNARNHRTDENLVNELHEAFTIEDPNYRIGLSVNYPCEKKMTKGVFIPFEMNDDLSLYLEKNDIFKNDVYESFIFFPYIAVFYPEMMFEFFEKHIRPKTKMFIGSTDKDTAEKLYGKIDYYVNTPGRFAYETIDEWWPQIENNADKVDLVIPSAGSASKVITKRLWYKNFNLQVLDVGSLIDAVDGKKSRGWIRRKGHKVQKILPKQYRDKSLSFRLNALRGDFNYWYRRYIKYRHLNKKS